MHKITIQRMVPKALMPASSLLKKWANKTLNQIISKPSELNIRIVETAEMKDLNEGYRHKPGVTNVLSFPFDMPEEMEHDFYILGDIVICAEVVNQEASIQQKTREAHWAHMVVHGTLHLLGYDHETEADAATMEPEETAILFLLGFHNPYQLMESIKGKHD